MSVFFSPFLFLMLNQTGKDNIFCHNSSSAGFYYITGKQVNEKYYNVLFNVRNNKKSKILEYAFDISSICINENGYIFGTEDGLIKFADNKGVILKTRKIKESKILSLIRGEIKEIFFTDESGCVYSFDENNDTIKVLFKIAEPCKWAIWLFFDNENNRLIIANFNKIYFFSIKDKKVTSVLGLGYVIDKIYFDSDNGNILTTSKTPHGNEKNSDAFAVCQKMIYILDTKNINHLRPKLINEQGDILNIFIGNARELAVVFAKDKVLYYGVYKLDGDVFNPFVIKTKGNIDDYKINDGLPLWARYYCDCYMTEVGRYVFLFDKSFFLP